MGNWVKVALACGLLLAGAEMRGQTAGAVQTTTVQGTMYEANGTPAQGTMLVSWKAFTTAAGQAVSAGNLTVALGADGFASLNLAPNVGAYPAGSYYTVVLHLSNGTVSTEYWQVPAAATASIASVQAQLAPSMVAVQMVTKSYVDNLVASLAGTTGNYLPVLGGSLTGPLTLSGDPASPLEAADKHYVDEEVATAVPVAGGVVTGTLGMGNAITKLPRVDVRDADFAGGADATGAQDSTAAIEAAIAFALASSPGGNAAYPVVYLPPGHYKIAGTLRIPRELRMEGDSKDGTILQETDPTANLITVAGEAACSTYVCYGGLSNLTLEGTGKATTGTLLEMELGFYTLRNLHFFNNGGRGLQMNGATERVTGNNLSFYQVRWPMILGGDSNEDYFYNTHVIEAGQTSDFAQNTGVTGKWCYSVNCTAGHFALQGTAAAPTIIYPDPHGAIDIDKAVNVSFIGGSVKSSDMLSGVKVWNGQVVRFQNFYAEDIYYSGNVPSTNRAYLIGGSGEKTYLRSTLGSGALSASVADGSWMPQYFGLASDALLNNGDWFPYVILPQDYDRTSTAPSAYVSGINRNQYEVVNAEGFAGDGNLYLQSRNAGGTAPTGTVWPAGSVVEEYTTGGAQVELDGVHINQIQGPEAAANGWQAGCDDTTSNACGEVVVGYMPDVQNPTTDPATNQVGFYTPLGDKYDPVNGAAATLSMKNVQMYRSGSVVDQGAIIAEHRANILINGPVDAEHVESTLATASQGAGLQLSISQATGGSVVFAPMYSSGQAAGVVVSMPDAEEFWDSSRGTFEKHTSMFTPNTQYGTYMNGLQYQNLYCIFDTPLTDGAHIQNRFCNGGGPSNASSTLGVGYGGGIEYDSWDGARWQDLFKVNGVNGAGTLYAGAAAQFASTLSITGAVTAKGSLTAATLNGAITVDGSTYTTVNSAWNGAAAAATATGRNQTIWLGPGLYPVTATMTEPTNGTCVSVVGSAGATSGADVGTTGTTLTVTKNLGGDVFLLGNAVLTEGCTFKDLNILAAKNATHGFEIKWARGLLLDTVTVNDTTAEGVLLGEESTTNGHQTSTVLRNVTVSYSSSAFTPASRPAYGVHLQQTAIDSVLQTVTVRNALSAAVWNEGTGNLGYGIHGFGYPYTCATGPCSNTASSGTAANASYATNYVVYDTGGAGSTWSDTYADSPAVSAFYVGANGVEIHGGHVQWPEFTSFPSANFATVSAGVTNNLMISDVSCLGMSSSVNWISYLSASGVPPTNASVHHLTGCGNYYQALEPATTTGFSGGGASNNAPGNGAVAAVWAAPKAGAATYSAYSAQEYNGYQGDLFDGHIAGQMPFFNVTYQGTIRSAGGLALSAVLNTASMLALTTANRTVIANAVGGAQTITLPSCYTAMPDKASPTGLEIVVLKSDTSANAVTLSTLSGQTIDYNGVAAATLVIAGAGRRTLVCGPDSNWYAY